MKTRFFLFVVYGNLEPCIFRVYPWNSIDLSTELFPRSRRNYFSWGKKKNAEIRIFSYANTMTEILVRFQYGRIVYFIRTKEKSFFEKLLIFFNITIFLTKRVLRDTLRIAFHWSRRIVLSDFRENTKKLSISRIDLFSSYVHNAARPAVFCSTL